MDEPAPGFFTQAIKAVAPGAVSLAKAAQDEPPAAPQRSLLFYLSALFTAALIPMQLAESLSKGRYFAHETMTTQAFLLILGFYAADKEAGHWASRLPEKELRKRKGEWFIAIWAVWTLVMGALPQFDPERFGWAEPHNLSLIFKAVMTIFLGSLASKRVRQWTEPKRLAK